MADKTLNVRVKHRYDTEANWTSKNPVLLAGELAFSKDKNGRYKVGDGTSKWTDLPYATANSLAEHASGEGFEYGYAYSKTITIPKTTTVTTYYVQIAKDADFRFKNYYIRTSGNNTQYSFKAEISANAYMSPHIILNTQKYNTNEVKNILVCKGTTNSACHNIFLVIDSATSYNKTIYIWSDNSLLDTVSTTAPATATELNVNILTEDFIYTSKKVVANISGSATSAPWSGITGKPSTYPPSSHTHSYLPLNGGTLTGALTAPNIIASNYFTTPTMLGEGSTSTYYHRVDFGHSGVNQFDFYEYGGLYNFYQNQSAGKDKAVLLGKITANGWEGNVVGNVTGKASTAGTADVANSVDWSKVTNKPSTFTPSSHSHTFNQISDRTTYIYDASTSRTKNTVLAAPNGSDGKATFRALTAADIPNLTKSKISDFPTSMPASDVSSWAKASTKPSYTKAEVGLGNVDNTADANKSVKYATSAGSAESCTGNAATATKLATSRTVSGGTDITMSFNYDGSGNSLANIGYYNCNASNGNTNNYPYHRFAKLDVIADPYRDQTMTVYITQDYNGGCFGIARISLRTNNSSYVSEAEAKWLVRSGFSADALQVAIYEVYGKTYADAFIKLPGTYNGTVIRAIANGGRGSISRTWTLINSREVDSTTTSDAKTSTESYVNITTAGTEIHNQAYSKIITGVDAGTTSAANSVAWGGISGKPAIVGKTIKSRSNLGDANWTDLTTAQGLIPDMAFISYWNGAFSGASSNLAYCNKGAFGSIVTKNINDYATANHNHDSVYAKLSHNHAISDITNLQTTLNGKANSSHTHSYLPLSGGTLTGNLTVNGGITTSSDIIIPSICFSQDKDSIALGMTADNTIIVPNHKITIGNLLKANGGISTEDISTTNIDITKLTFTRSTAASINFSNNKVSINSAGLNVDNGASFGAAISINGTVIANGSVRFIDYYSESTGDGNTRRAVSSSATDGLKVGYLKSKTNSSTSKKQFCVMGQWGKEDDFGNATTKGSWTTGYILIDSTSDVRLKKNIKNTDISALPIINQMKVRQFDWKETGVHQQLGLVADELDKFDPLLTVGGGYEADGSMYVKQIDRLLLTEYAIKGIQEQQDEIVELQKENKELKQKISEIDTLKDELIQLKALIMNK